MEPVEFSIRDNWIVSGYKMAEDEDEEGCETGRDFDDVDLTSGKQKK